MQTLEDKFLRLSYADLLKATDRFSEANLLGYGRFGSIYKGIVDDKQLSVVVKVVNLEIKGASKSFLTECDALRGIRHRNLLKILSVCESIDFQGNEFMALIYELMDTGSTDKWLHNDDTQEEGHPHSESNRNLSITQKLNIVVDVAFAVEYLHHGTNSIVIHGDLKPSNILSDENMTAHGVVLDWQKWSRIYFQHTMEAAALWQSNAPLATFLLNDQQYDNTRDVYSFGILMLEMFTNIWPTDDYAALNGQSILHHLVSYALQNKELNIVDQIIPHKDKDNRKIRNCVSRILEIGVACSMELPKDRMMMTDDVRDLQKIRKAYLAE